MRPGSFSLNIEAVSCDEMYVDLSDLLSPANYSSEVAEPGRIINPFLLGSELRRRVFEATGCTATCGFGTNRLLTRLATVKAKPNNQAFLIGASTHSAGAGNKLTPVDVVWHRADEGGPAGLPDCLIYEMEGEGRNYLDSLPISSLPGIGRSTAERLLTKHVTTCGDLRQKLSLPQLSNLLGAKTGKRLYQLCQGKDSSDLMLDRFAKSVSAEINYGVRLASWPEVQDFVSSLVFELASRMEHAATDADDRLGVLGRTLVVRLLTRRADQPKEAVKFMGHGICDTWTRTVQLPTPTRDVSFLTSQCMSVLRRINPDPTDIRGMGLQMQRLSPARHLKKSSIEIIALPIVSKSCGTSKLGGSPPAEQSEPCFSSALSEFPGTEDNNACTSLVISTPGTPISSTVVDRNVARTWLDTSRSSEDEPTLCSPMDKPPLSVEPVVSVTSTPIHFTRPPAVKISPVKKTPSPTKSPSSSMTRPQASSIKMPVCSRPSPMMGDQEASDGARVFAKRSVEEIRCMLTAWVSGIPAPEEEDVRMLSEYLTSIVPTNLVRVRDILADLQRLLNSLLPVAAPTVARRGSAADLWHTAFARIKAAVDRTCKVHFGANSLSLSS
uniref:DNA repair protein REV1 n=1 Tax=Schistocephalus solidus TaxID=70667 RepID=A0A0X3NRB1_SCHSO